MADHAIPLAIPAIAILEQPREPMVLCIDDNQAILEVLSDILTLNGYRVMCESDPKRACRWIRAINPDAVIVDYDMPELNGCEVARIVRREKPRLPVLMFSGTLLPSESLDAVWAFVAKNRGVEALIDALRSSLAQS